MRLKLGPHFQDGGQTATQRWLALKPSVAKFCFRGFELAALADPGTLCVGRPSDDAFAPYHVGQGDAATQARAMVARVFAPLVAAYPRIAVWEAINEPAISDRATMQWYAAFSAEFARQMHALGSRAGLGSWAVGCPDFAMWADWGPALRACRDYGAVLCRHSYAALDQWYSYRHRQDEIWFQQLGFANTPVIISECGVDRPMAAGWKKLYGSEQEYCDKWVLPFTLRVNQDSYVLGATLFTAGTGFASAWDNYNVGQTTVDAIKADFPTVEETPMTKYLCAVSAMFVMESDTQPANADVMAEARNRLTPGFPRYGLQVTQAVWSESDTPPVTPPAPPTGKQWRVLFSPCKLHDAANSTATVIGTAYQGDVLTQLDDAQPPDWVHTTRGWILSKQVAAA